MARRKAEQQLQSELESTEEFEEMLGREGLTVVDVYQEWCGPCRGMVSNFRKLKNELGDSMLHFAVAKADTIDFLEKYRGKCEPCFLFFATGCMVSVVRGANSPLLIKTITEQLAYEHKVLEGSVERKEIKDEKLSPAMEEEEEVDSKLPFKNGIIKKCSKWLLLQTLVAEGTTRKGVTVAIIKPDVVADGKVDEIIEEMKKAGIEILEKQERQLTEEEAREFYDHKKDEPFFEDLIKFMTSGPSVALVLTKGETGEGIIEEWRELLGPPSVEEAKESAPDSLRARFGRETYANALHGSDSTETATRELAFFFPQFAAPTIASKTKKRQIQRTLALIRPDALADRKDEILLKIKESGFVVAMQKEVRLSPEQAAEFYKEHEGQPYYQDLVDRMSSGPLLALALARDDAVQGWRDLLGPKEVKIAKEEAPESFRAQFSAEDDVINPIHGSDNPEHAQQELNYFFPMQKTVAVIKPDAYENKDSIMDKIKEAGFNIAARKETELTKEIAEQFYKAQEGSEYFEDLTQHMTSGKTLFMVLTREDAVDGWRSLIGPKDPEEAKTEAPETIRAQFGKDTLANAVHGSANPEEAEHDINVIFGDLDITTEGTEEDAEAEAKTSEEGRPEGSDAQSPEEKSQDAPEAGSSEAKSPEAGSPEAKSPEGAPSEAKSPEAGSPEAKSPEAGSPEAKSPEGAPSEAKSPEAGSPEAKSPEPGSEKAKSPEPESEAAKSPEPGSESAKSPEPGSESAKSPEPGSESAKSPEPGSEAAKSPEPESEKAKSPEPESEKAKSPESGAISPESGSPEETKSPEAADA
ncbi:hypothetical protein NP493_140g00039 [Ridgeia piscesae]|uniref:Nucleoside diphosphate kinase-like domain-containing protein n=1 Tax=Ridgeia piscesae TaxID=27915 RepID=A0AAD9UG77_RIDPI|nr:hypothetical protein NP493_140g00039 [Ridgeia piscesae]